MPSIDMVPKYGPKAMSDTPTQYPFQFFVMLTACAEGSLPSRAECTEALMDAAELSDYKGTTSRAIAPPNAKPISN
jgi:hypothetical protein